jgi:hypothetical protein
MFESDCPEFIISEKLFTWRLECIENAGFPNLVGLPVVAYFSQPNENVDQEMGAYPTKIMSLLENSDQEPDEHLMNSGYGTLRVEWDDGTHSALSPWEVTFPDSETPSPPCLDEAEIRSIGNALAKIETNPTVKEFFLRPVDGRQNSDYHSRVEVAMDFSFIKERLAAGYYSCVESVLADAKLIRENCIKYNGPSAFLSQSASAIYGEFEQEVRGSIQSSQNLRSTSLDALNGMTSHVAASRAMRHAQRQQQGSSTRRSSAEASSLEQLPLPNARHIEGRLSRRRRLGQNIEPSLVTMAPIRATRSGIAGSEVMEEENSEGDRSISEHDQEYLDAVQELPEASSSERRSKSECRDDVAPTRRPNASGQGPSRQNITRRSARTNRAPVKRKDPESSVSDDGDGSEWESLASEDEHLSEVDDESPMPSARRPTRASANSSPRENSRSSSRRSRAHAKSMKDDHSSEEEAESPPPSSRRLTRAVTSCRGKSRTSSRLTGAHTNSTEYEHSSEEDVEAPPSSPQRSTRASTAMSHREEVRTSPRLSRARANSTEQTSSPRHTRSAQPTKSMADLSNSEIDDDEDSSEEEEKRNVSQRQKGGRGKSKQESSDKPLCVLICSRSVTVGP